MSASRRPGLRGARGPAAAGIAAVALLLGGCSQGVMSHAGTPFTSCLSEAGVDLSRMASWTREDERDVLADPAALACVRTALPAHERREVLAWAFPDLTASSPDAEQAVVADAVGAYLAERTPGDADALAGAGELLAALGMRGSEPEGVRDAIALDVHRDAAGALYEAWREGAGLADDLATRVRFVREQVAAGGALADLFSSTTAALETARAAAAD